MAKTTARAKTTKTATRPSAKSPAKSGTKITNMSVGREGGTKLGGLFAVLVFVGAIITGGAIIVNAAGKDAKAAFNSELQSAVESLAGAVAQLNTNCKDGKIDCAIAKDLSLQIVENSTWSNGARAFAAIDNNGDMIGHIDDSTGGSDVFAEQDSDGKYVFQELVKEAKNGGGFVSSYYKDSGRFVSYAKDTGFDFIIQASYNTKNVKSYSATFEAVQIAVLIVSVISLLYASLAAIKFRAYSTKR